MGLRKRKVQNVMMLKTMCMMGKRKHMEMMMQTIGIMKQLKRGKRRMRRKRTKRCLGKMSSCTIA